jgi:signal peptidase I
MLSSARRRGRATRQDMRRLMRRARGRLGAAPRAQIEQAQAVLDAALQLRDPAATDAACDRLEQLATRSLGPFMRASWLESIESVGYAVIVALLLRALVLEAFKIPSGSMIPTLAIGDQIFVNKSVYGPRVPFTFWRPVHLATPKRGEVVVFVCPIEPHEDYIKRIVAVGGDEVAVRDGVVYINGAAMPHEPLGEVTHWDRDSAGVHWRAFRARAHSSTLGGHTFTALQDADIRHHAADFGPHVVPAGHVFVMGDNRDHSYDSRAWGPVPIDNILGRAMFVWWSWGHEGARLQRLGTWID